MVGIVKHIKSNNMILKVCVGSSCHLKDSYEVINLLKGFLKEYDVESIIDLQASFCHGSCVNGVTAKIENCECAADVNIEEDGSIMLHKLSVDNIKEIFVSKVLPLIK